MTRRKAEIIIGDTISQILVIRDVVTVLSLFNNGRRREY